MKRLSAERLTRRAVLSFVLCLLLASLLVVQAAASTQSPVYRGATYEGKGHQTHFRKTGDAKNSGFPLKFHVTRSGRRVTDLNVYPALLAYCTHRVDVVNPHFRIVQATSVGSARIDSRGAFLTHIRANDGSLVASGQFLAAGRARGTVRFQGRAKYRSCRASAVWHAVVMRYPPVAHFAGSTAEGTAVTFERTIEKHPHVTRFAFGSLTTSCGGTTSVGTGRNFFPPYDEFALPIKDGSFSGSYSSGDTSVDISGHLGANEQISGTVSYEDRGGCNTGTVAWTAQPAG